MKKKMTAHSITIKHKKMEKKDKHMKRKAGEFASNRREEELEDEGKKKHMKHMKRKSAGMKCKECGSTAHAMHPATATKKHAKKKSFAAKEQTANARFERMRKKVFNLK
jgi:hypothetical protein